MCVVFCDIWAPGICLQTFQLLVIDPSPIPKLIWKRPFLNCIVYLAIILAFYCSIFCMLSPFHLRNCHILLYQTDMEITWMSFFKIQNNSFRVLEPPHAETLNLILILWITLTKFGKRRKNWDIFFFHNAFFVSLSWCFIKCLVLLFLTISVLFYFQADICILVSLESKRLFLFKEHMQRLIVQNISQKYRVQASYLYK